MHQIKASYAIDYESIFRHAPVGMCISVDRVIQSANEALATMFGSFTLQNMSVTVTPAPPVAARY